MPRGPVRRSVPKSLAVGGWSTPLSAPINLKDGTTLVTLGDAAMFIADHPENKPRMGWNEAAVGLLRASEQPTPENIQTATDRAASAFYFNGLRAVQ